MEKVRLLVVVLVALATACTVKVQQRRFGTYGVGVAVKQDGGTLTLHQRLRCDAVDRFGGLLGKVFELRDRVLLNPGGMQDFPGVLMERRKKWEEIQARGGVELSRCLRMVLERMPTFRWADVNMAAARIGLAETQVVLPGDDFDETKQREREQAYRDYLRSAGARLDRILQQRPGFVPGHLLRAEVMALEGRHKEAGEHFERVATLGGQSSHVQAWLGYLDHVQRRTPDGRFAEAVRMDTHDEATAYARYALAFLERSRKGRLYHGEAKELLLPPFYRPELPRKPTEVSHFLMRVAVEPFRDETRVGAFWHRLLADSLTTELVKTGRFEVYDPGQLPGGATRQWQVDAVVGGAITRIDWQGRRAEIEVRATAAYDGRVLFARRYDVPFLSPQRRVTQLELQDGRTQVDKLEARYQLDSGDVFGVDRATLTRVANDLHEAFPRVGDAKVNEVTPSHVVVGKGARDGVFRGMTGYVEASVDDLVDPKSPAGATSSGTYVGQLYFFSVEPSRSHATCYRLVKKPCAQWEIQKGQDPATCVRWGQNPCALQVGDVVRFK